MKKVIILILVFVMVVTTGCAEVISTDEAFGELVVDQTQDKENPPLEGDESNRPPREGEDENNRPPREGEDENNKPPRDGEDENNRPPREDQDESDRPVEQGQDDVNRPVEQGQDENNGPLEQIKNEGGSKYSVEQAISDNAQLTTIAFSGLAFLTGTEGADAFFPPGKVADFFGFQYMRDVDVSGYGHNTTFLTKVASNILYILDDEQIELLKDLASEQEDLYETYGYGRLNIIDAFRKNYEDDEALDFDGITEYSSYLYGIDGQLSYHRAEAFGKIIESLTDEQIEYIDQMKFDDSSTWPEMEEEGLLDKKSMSHLSHVAVMTYASEFFSWYAGSEEADVYFCPERHGTYFGGFYMKDYPAMGDPDYFISTSVTGDSGKEFVELLNDEQRVLMTSILDEQRDDLNRIVEIRTEVSELLRGFTTGETVDEETVMTLMNEYGEIEGEMSYRYASRFSEIGKTLTDDQKDAMYELRNQYVFPEGSYLYSAPIEMLDIIDSDLHLNK